MREQSGEDSFFALYELSMKFFEIQVFFWVFRVRDPANASPAFFNMQGAMSKEVPNCIQASYLLTKGVRIQFRHYLYENSPLKGE